MFHFNGPLKSEEDKKSEEEQVKSRRNFLKGLGVAVGVGAAATVVGGVKLGQFLEKEGKESREHEKQGEAVIISKEIINSKDMPPMPDNEHIPYRGVNTNYVHLKMNDKESVVVVTDNEYDKFKVGDMVPVKYDDRNMKVEEIINNKEK